MSWLKLEYVKLRGNELGREYAMTENAGAGGDTAPEGVTITARVCVFPSTDDEAHGVVVEDFGDGVGIPVEIGGSVIAGPARRWAVMLDDDNLVFVEGHQLIAE
jgi:hypothetical protein